MHILVYNWADTFTSLKSLFGTMKWVFRFILQMLQLPQKKNKSQRGYDYNAILWGYTKVYYNIPDLISAISHQFITNVTACIIYTCKKA